MQRLVRAINHRITFLFENSRFLIVGTIIALIWANLDHHGYEHFRHANHFWVNELAMVLFFGVVTKEIWEAFLPGGSLHNPRQALLPLMATVGGMAGPAAVFLAGCALLGPAGGELQNGWAIPCATDIAFSYMVARLIFGAGHPAIPFLLLLAIADDALGLIILAVFYPTADPAPMILLIFLLTAMGIGWLLQRCQVRSFWWYLLLPGTVSWYGLYLGGVHPALALVPIIPFMPHATHDRGLFAESEDRRQSTLDHFKSWWERPVELILGIFALVNAGVVFGSIGPATGLVATGLIFGKPLGIVLMSCLGLMLGLRLPTGMRFPHLLLLGITAGIGFTVALFVATVAYPEGEILDAAKMGALASFLSAPLAFILVKLLGIKPVLSADRRQH